MVVVNITDVIALLAFLVALYGAILSTYVAINEFFRLKLSVFNLNKTYITLSQSDYYSNDHGEQIPTYKSDLYSIVLLVRIINMSKNDTTINEIILNDEYTLNSSSKSIENVPCKFKYSHNMIFCNDFKYLSYPVISFPLKIEALSTVEGYLVFNNMKEIPNFFKVKIKAIQKSKTFNLNISIPNDYRNEILSE